MPVPVHNDLHAETLRIPAPSLVLARFVLKTINNLENEYNTLDTTKAVIDGVYAIDDDESELFATRLDAQIPFLEQGEKDINHHYFVNTFLQKK